MSQHLKCLRCNRPLTNPESRERGYGEICASKMAMDGTMQQLALENFDLASATVSVPLEFYSLERGENDEPITNIPFYSKHAKLWSHSPNGFEWGYEGSGPAELARNIIFDACGDWDKTQNHYQDFKREFIARIPFEGGKIEKKRVMDWIEKRESQFSRVMGHALGHFSGASA